MRCLFLYGAWLFHSAKDARMANMAVGIVVLESVNSGQLERHGHGPSHQCFRHRCDNTNCQWAPDSIHLFWSLQPPQPHDLRSQASSTAIISIHIMILLLWIYPKYHISIFFSENAFSTEAGRLTGMSVHVSSIQGGISHTDDENLLQCVEQAYPLVGRLPRRALRLHDGQCGLDLDVSCSGPRITSPSYDEVSDFARSVVTNLPSWLIP